MKTERGLAQINIVDLGDDRLRNPKDTYRVNDVIRVRLLFYSPSRSLYKATACELNAKADRSP